MTAPPQSPVLPPSGVQGIAWNFELGEDETGGPAFFWENPWNGRREKIASLWWPAHPVEATATIERLFENLRLSTGPKSEKINGELLRIVLRSEMQSAWTTICSDTDCHPLDIERRGKELFYKPGHWTDLIALFLSSHLAAISASVAGEAKKPLNQTIWGAIAAVYGELDDEDCAFIDRTWANQRGLTIAAPSPALDPVTRASGGPDPTVADRQNLAKILNGWAKAYRDSPEHRFPSDPNAEFFPIDLENAARALLASPALKDHP